LARRFLVRFAYGNNRFTQKIFSAQGKFPHLWRYHSVGASNHCITQEIIGIIRGDLCEIAEFIDVIITIVAQDSWQVGIDLQRIMSGLIVESLLQSITPSVLRTSPPNASHFFGQENYFEHRI
jgi:hypothetical protein